MGNSFSRIKYSADFETTTDEQDCRVWAWGLCEIGNPKNFLYGNDINTLIEFCQERNYILYFHNLKFDGEFIISWLLNNEYRHIKDKKEKEDKTFTTLISDDGKFYSIEIYFKVGNKKMKYLTIYDSLKILNMPVLKIAKAFGLGEQAEKIKEEKIDYNKYREKGHILTDEEIEYLKNDVEVVSVALNQLFNEDLKKITQGSDALYDYKKIIGENNFTYYFPILPYEIDETLRQSYRGGFCYVNPTNQNKIIKNIMVLDVNSLYPSVMYQNLLPVGNPEFYIGEYKEDKFFPLYIQQIKCSFDLKKGYLPTLLAKNSYMSSKQYLTTSDGEIMRITLTNIDLELFLKHYEVRDLDYIQGFKFRGKLHLFDKYIEKWSEVKIKSKKEGNLGMYQISKIMLNSLYGKFGSNPNVASKSPYLNEEGIIKYLTGEQEQKDSIYIPMASFITAYARKKTIETSQKIKDYSLEKYKEDYYIYSDTDSIHAKSISIEELKNFLEIDSYKLGAWDMEHGKETNNEVEFGKYIRQKSYIDFINGVYKITCAGLSQSCIRYNKDKTKVFYKIFEADECKYNDNNPNCDNCEHIGKYKGCFWKEFNINDFKVGFTCGGKLTYKHVKGGIVLVETSFELKEKFL